jgi:catechol 2,3-dioxygenase-like lactoylglutathione lyase family enzyme
VAFERCSTILGCRDVARSAAWFRDVLGFHLDPDTGLFGDQPNEGAVYGILDRDGVTLHLQIRRLDLPTERQDIETDAYVNVSDVDALYAEYQAAGVTIHRPIEDAPYGMRDFCISTPDGHRVAFGSPR